MRRANPYETRLGAQPGSAADAREAARHATGGGRAPLASTLERMTEIELRQRITAHRGIALTVACALGVLLSLSHDAFQILSLPLAEWAQERFLATDGSFVVENVINFMYQGITFLIHAIIIVLILTKLIQTKTLLYPSVAYAANLVFGLWWLPVVFLLGAPSLAMQTTLPLLPASILGTTLAYFGVAYWVLRRYAL